MLEQQQPAPKVSPSSSPDDRATSFEAAQGAPIPEMQSGERLLVEAYIFIWIIAMIFVQIMWLRQRGTARRLDALERAIDRKDRDSDIGDKTVVKARPPLREED